jgi:hypothetical protein
VNRSLKRADILALDRTALAAAPDRARRFHCTHLALAVFVTNSEAEKSVIYGSRETGFVEGKRLIST